MCECFLNLVNCYQVLTAPIRYFSPFFLCSGTGGIVVKYWVMLGDWSLTGRCRLAVVAHRIVSRKNYRQR